MTSGMELRSQGWCNGLLIPFLIDRNLTKPHHLMNSLRKLTRLKSLNMQRLPRLRTSKFKKYHSTFWFMTSSLLCSFTREKVETMLKYITELPPEDSNKKRGHTLPFHCDMIFQFQNKKINDRFFASNLSTP